MPRQIFCIEKEGCWTLSEAKSDPPLISHNFRRFSNFQKRLNFKGVKVHSANSKFLVWKNEGFSTFSEAKTDPPLSGFEFCSKSNYDLTLPEIRRKTVMSKKCCKTTDFQKCVGKPRFWKGLLILTFYSRKCASKP